MKTNTPLTLGMQFMPRAQEAKEAPGIYALWCQEGRNKSLLTVKETENVKLSLIKYNKLQHWRTRHGNHIVFAACYTPGLSQQERMEMAQALKHEKLHTHRHPIYR